MALQIASCQQCIGLLCCAEWSIRIVLMHLLLRAGPKFPVRKFDHIFIRMMTTTNFPT